MVTEHLRHGRPLIQKNVHIWDSATVFRSIARCCAVHIQEHADPTLCSSIEKLLHHLQRRQSSKLRVECSIDTFGEPIISREFSREWQTDQIEAKVGNVIQHVFHIPSPKPVRRANIGFKTKPIDALQIDL